MDLFPLVLIFLVAGFLALFYFLKVPEKEILKERLPNKPSAAGIVLWLIIVVILYFLIRENRGFERTMLIFTFIFSLLFFETLFLFLIRFFNSNLIAVLISLLSSATLFLFHYLYPTFALRNILIILGTLGATTLLIKLNYLKTWIVFGLAFLWTGYDIYTTRNILPNVLSPVTEAPKTFFFPSVITGSVSLGSGDFIFLVIFTLIILKKFGKFPATILIAAQTVGLLFTGLFLESDSIIPFLAVMFPIFLIIYLISYLNGKEKIVFNEFLGKKIPADISLALPDNSTSHTLVYIPWNDKYLKFVPTEYKNFFLKTLPFLHVRTTDVHTACSISFLDRIIKLHGHKVNRRVIALGLILHDTGWSKLTEQEIIDSLSDYKGIAFGKISFGPKEKHCRESAKIAEELLANFIFEPSLKAAEKEEIIQAVKYHDDPEKCSLNGQIVADLDRLWSFTHENFWQDTIRKDFTSKEYHKDLYHDYKTYFFTKAAKTLAEELLKQRKNEIHEFE